MSEIEGGERLKFEEARLLDGDMVVEVESVLEAAGLTNLFLRPQIT